MPEPTQPPALIEHEGHTYSLVPPGHERFNLAGRTSLGVEVHVMVTGPTIPLAVGLVPLIVTAEALEKVLADFQADVDHQAAVIAEGEARS